MTLGCLRVVSRHACEAAAGIPSRLKTFFVRSIEVRISANVTADFGNVTDSARSGVARCRL
jgi:hypothetical protein